jgi:hypothetical protein
MLQHVCPSRLLFGPRFRTKHSLPAVHPNLARVEIVSIGICLFESYLSAPVYVFRFDALPLGTGRVTRRHRRAYNTFSGRPLSS